jgi:transposase
MAAKRKRYTAEFKAEAVRLVEDNKLSAVQVGRDLGVDHSLVSRWVAAARGRRAPDTLTTEERVELVRLRKENTVLRQEREILKKAAAFFAKETQ